MATDGSAKRHPGGPIDLRIAFASKKLFAEVMTTFFENNVIELNIHPDATVGLPVLLDPKALLMTTYCFKGFDSESLEKSLDQALTCLETLSGVQELVFTDNLDEYWEQGLGTVQCLVLGTQEHRERLRSVMTKPKEPPPRERS
ncbi:MAG: hypothetical protein Q9207_004899 [Kuettlingeria erythrocarpa]